MLSRVNMNQQKDRHADRWTNRDNGQSILHHTLQAKTKTIPQNDGQSNMTTD